MVLLISRDLMASSTVSSTAKSIGVPLRTLAADGVEGASEAEAVTLVAIDLAGLNEAVEDLVERVRKRWPQAEIVAFGPHVATHELEQARQAGCERVLARGQFLAQLQSILIVDKQ
jgi:hypothetical protein